MFVENNLEKRKMLKDITLCKKELLSLKSQVQNTYNKNYNYMLNEEQGDIKSVLGHIVSINRIFDKIEGRYF